VILFTENNSEVTGFDTPTFALYIDGTAIYWQGDRQSGKYVTAKLSQSQVSELAQTAHLDKVESFSNCYSIDDATDAPTNRLVVKTSQGFKAIEVSGVVRDMKNVSPKRLPVDLQIAFRTLLAFHADEAHLWQPPYFEVILGPFAYAKSAQPWPANFPDLTDTKARALKNSYHLFVPISKLSEYQAFERGIQPTQAVLIGGRKWTTSARFPFPHESAP
ncbi:MAG: hypothetical protein ABI158_09135, partial [Edaphobacter sp.]